MTESKGEKYERLAIRLVRAMMRSASPHVIPPIQWWSRATTALQTGAAECLTRGRFSALISKMAGALQIASLRFKSAQTIADIERDIDADEIYDFADVCARDAVFIVAKASIESKAEREAWEREEAELAAVTAESLAALASIVPVSSTVKE